MKHAPSTRLVTALALATTTTAVAASALVLLLAGADGSARASAAGHATTTHAAGGEGTDASSSPSSHAAQMIGDAVQAPDTTPEQDALLDLPPAEPAQAGRVREFTLVAKEHEIEIAKGVTFNAWTFVAPGGTPSVPGPTLRVTEGDLVRITLRNDTSQPHSLHTHGIHPSSQDGVLEMVEPGDEFTYEFTAGPSGVQPYHCHAMPIKKHIGKGMYGTIIIDPKVAPPAPDREMVMVMNAYDTNADDGNEVYTVNGGSFIYAKRPIRVKRGELVRIYLVNMTENDPINSFHVHGNFFDYRPIGFDNPSTYTDLVSQVQGDRGIIDIRFPNAGPFMFHAHQTEFSDLGWMGFFEVTE